MLARGAWILLRVDLFFFVSYYFVFRTFVKRIRFFGCISIGRRRLRGAPNFFCVFAYIQHFFQHVFHDGYFLHSCFHPFMTFFDFHASYFWSIRTLFLARFNKHKSIHVPQPVWPGNIHFLAAIGNINLRFEGCADVESAGASAPDRVCV